jgi:hypothetical protein
VGVGLKRSIAAAIVVLVALGIGALTIVTRPDVSRGGRFVFADEGHNLRVTSVVSGGGRLYQDVFTPYGPAAAWAAISAARIGGNTPLTYDFLILFLNTTAIAFVFFTLSRLATPAWALALTLICAVPAMLAPGSMLGGLMVSPYVALERCVFAALMWMWQPSSQRSWKRSLAIGLVAGACQWIRFGTVILAAGGLVAADLVAERSRDDRRGLMRHLAIVASGVIAAEVLLVAWAFATLPGAVAADLVWPAYFVSSYDWVTAAERWPTLSVRSALAQYGAAIAGLALGPFVLWRSRRSVAAPLIAFLLCAYVLGIAGLFRHAHHFRQYAWWLTVAAALVASISTVRVRVAVLAASAVVFVTMIRGVMMPPAPGVWVETPSSGAVYLTASEAEDVAALNALAATVEGRGQSLIVGPLAAGWHVLFEHRSPIRHAWFLSTVVRPREAEAIGDAMSAAGAIVVCGQDKSLRALNLPAPVAAKVAGVFSRSRPISGRCDAHVRE